MTDQRFEARLDDLFKAYAERGVRPIDRFAIAQSTLATARVRPARMPWAAPRWRLAIVTVLLLGLAATAAIVGSRLLDAPRPIVEAVPIYAAVILRDTPGAEVGSSVDIIAARTDGREHLIRRITSAELGGRVLSANGKVSPNGWLSLWVSGSVPRNGTAALIDLNDPARQPTYIEAGTGPSTAWSTTDLFAYPSPFSTCFWSMLVTDPRTGATSPERCLSLPGGGPDTIWAADGTGILTHAAPNDVPGIGQTYGISPLVAGPVNPTVPRLGPNGPRWVTEAGRQLEVCMGAGSNPECTDTSVLVYSMGGPGTAWYTDELAPDALADAAFAFDGSAVYILLDRTRGQARSAVLARAVAPGSVSAVTTVGVRSDALYVLVTALAPDDSMFTIWTGLPVEEPGWLVLAGQDGTSIDVDGMVAGFMRGPLVDAAFGSK